jgi:hypothetical protein
MRGTEKKKKKKKTQIVIQEHKNEQSNVRGYS